MNRIGTIWVATVLVAVSFALYQVYGYAAGTLGVMAVSTALCGYPVVYKAIGSLRYRIVGIEVLVTIAILGALAIGEYWEAAAVTYLFYLGGYLEQRTLKKTRSSVKALLALAPDTARLRRDGVELVVDPQTVAVGEKVIVKPGERIAVDGTITEGTAVVNQSALTGESLPLQRRVGEFVYAGTIVQSGYMVVRAERVGNGTTFARIIELVEEAQDAKAKTEKFIQRFSRYYTPAIILLSLLLYAFSGDIRLSLTLLVIACPGALVISVPVSIVAGIGNGARKGILVKGGDVMERMGNVQAIAFDKTGTLTKGKPTVVFVHTCEGDPQEIAIIAASGESYSEHPIAQAIVRYATTELGAKLSLPSSSHPIAGMGITFTLDDQDYLVGNRTLFAQHGLSFSAVEPIMRQEEEKGRTVVLVGTHARIIGLLAVSDVVQDDAKALIASLKKLGVQHVVMLTGDNQHTALFIAEQLHVDEFQAELLPEDKVAAIQQLSRRYTSVAMVGDGVNDAPALAASDLGIAIGEAGRDVAMETADVVVMSGHLGQLSYAIELARSTMRTMKQNIAFAILVAVVLLAGVLIRTVNLSFGMLVHELSVLLVIGNAMRLRRYGSNR